MIGRNRLRFGCFTAGLCLACTLPTERSDLRVAVGTDTRRMVVGERADIGAQLLDASGQPVTGRGFTYRSTNTDVVVPESDDMLLAVGTGEALVVVEALSFEGAAADTLLVRVSANVSVDSIYPSTLRFGEVMTVVGNALDPAAASLIAVGAFPAPIASFTAATSDSTSRDTLRLYTPVGAGSSDLVILRRDGGSVTVPVQVLPNDLFEPNDSAPARWSDVLTFGNPELSLEAGMVRPFDWYRFGPVNQSFTIELRPGFVSKIGVGVAAVRSPVSGRADVPQWSITAMSDSTLCRGLVARMVPHAAIVDNDASQLPIRFALQDITLDSFDLTLEMFASPVDDQGYQVSVQPGYRSVFPPDGAEENDFCNAATRVSDGYNETLTIDDSYDVDWFRFSLADTSDVLVSAACSGCPPPAQAGFNSIADVELIVYRDTTSGRPSDPTALPVVAMGTGFNPPLQQVSATLPPGDYFLLMHNLFFNPISEIELSVNITP